MQTEPRARMPRISRTATDSIYVITLEIFTFWLPEIVRFFTFARILSGDFFQKSDTAILSFGWDDASLKTYVRDRKKKTE